MMSNLEIISRLAEMLADAQDIIRQQAELLAMHGINTETGSLECARQKLLEDIENSI